MIWPIIKPILYVLIAISTIAMFYTLVKIMQINDKKKQRNNQIVCLISIIALVLAFAILFTIKISPRSCPNCDKIVVTNYCSDCGYKASENQHCINCGEQIEDDDAYCFNCGSATTDNIKE